MRMRRKKHLEERLENVSEYLLETDREISNVLEAVKDKKYIDFFKAFGNSNPVELEIGCGKGGFISQMTIKNQNTNFIAVEMIRNIIVLAIENASKIGAKNVKFLNVGAEYLPRYIREESIDNIYLNFSPPFPQKTNENRRLTNPRNAVNYKNFLKPNGKIIQKTDDKDFFDYSLEVFKANGFEVKDVSEALMLGKIDSVVTEYEAKFRAQNMPIYALIATKK